jgi:hypothetical protein
LAPASNCSAAAQAPTQGSRLGIRKVQGKHEQASEGCAGRQRFQDLRHDEQGRPGLENGIVAIGLPWIEPEEIEEEAPGHRARPNPNQPGRRQSRQDADNGIRQQNEPTSQTKGSWFRAQVHDPVRFPCSRAQSKVDLSPRQGILQSPRSAEHRGQRRTDGAPRIPAVHLPQIEPVTDDKSSRLGRRPNRIVIEGADDVDYDAIVVCRQPERCKRPDEPIKRGQDHS